MLAGILNLERSVRATRAKLALGRFRLRRDPLEHADHVHVALVRHAMPLPITLRAGRVLTEDANLETLRMTVAMAAHDAATSK